MIIKEIIDRYDCVKDIIEDGYDLKKYNIFDVMKNRNSEDFYVCGCFCVVKNNYGGLDIYHEKGRKSGVYLTESYLYADYYKLSDVNAVVIQIFNNKSDFHLYRELSI